MRVAVGFHLVGDPVPWLARPPRGVTRPGFHAVTGAAMLVVLPSLMQSPPAGLADDHANYGGLHAFDGLLILGIAGYLYARARQGES